MKYCTDPGIVLATVCDEHLLVATGEAREKLDYVKTVNKTGAYFWRLLEQQLDIETIISRAMEDYKVSEETVRPAFMQFFDSLRQSGYLIVTEEDA